VKLSDRRRELEDFASKCFAQNPTFRLSPASAELTDAQRWLKASGGGTDDRAIDAIVHYGSTH
jgi:hypothetical protein